MQVKRYLKFLLKSTNEHGVHSPFVYSFVTRCLYHKQLVKREEVNYFSPTLSQKQLIFLLKIIRYLEVKTIFTDEDLLNNISAIKEACNICFQLQSSVTYDLLFINHPKGDLDVYLNYMHNDSILIINNIHQKENELLWQTLTADEKVTAHIDVYYQGYAFIRREQRKEAFYIR
ncbi:O-methyltransferase [Capnocytophaga sp. HP1101]